MPTTVYSGTPDLRQPRRFLADAMSDLRRSVPIAFRLLRSSLRIRYRRSWLGYVWIILPAAAAALLSLLAANARLFRIAPTPIPYPLFVLIGVICWQLFAEALTMPSNIMASSQRTLTQIAVPHEALLLSGLLEILLSAALRLLLLAMPLLFLSDIRPGATLLLLPLGLLGLACLGVGVGLLLTPVGLLYDDVNRVTMLLLGVLFFLTPVIYPRTGGLLFRLNPISPLLDGSRAALTGTDVSAPAMIGLSCATASVILLAWLAYRVARPHLMTRLS